jgi:Ca-activated chloride channel family protein
MRLAHAWVLWLLPVYFGVEALIYYKIRRRILNLPTGPWIQPKQTWRTEVIRRLRWLPVTVGFLLLLALSGPQGTRTIEEILPSGIDIIVALDVSGSMAAEDFQPLNRLGVAKDVLRDFIRGRPSDRIGLILFSGRSVMRAPLTLQHEPLIRTLETVEMGVLPDGTAIGSAIMSGLNRLTQQTRGQEGERILLLITDGRNNAGEIHPRDALAIAVQQRIKIYTVGVGSFGDIPFPVIGKDGKKTYRYERADLDEGLLTEIAQRTGGRYFRAGDPTSLQQLFRQINTLEKSEPQKLQSRVVESQASWFTTPALLLTLAYVLITILVIRLP